MEAEMLADLLANLGFSNGLLLLTRMMALVPAVRV